ncbi:MAG: undecaprenyldiphospho-muramoylpentapeptide beta-N-acetylglucosaminyltransferase [Firmicutes bacterium]|nr:undecaprenyldiphospho-muramoylpentapeptide beta-N-acetylglucosaminyltransferase [Bacillota bacterium]
MVGEGLRILLTGGGTGGHIYPALAVARVLREEHGADLLYVGSRGSMESELVPREGIPFEAVTVSGLRGKSPRQVLLGTGRAAVAVGQALGILGRFRPRVVLGTGGYVTGPVVLAALLRRVPAVLQEQNVVPGATNRVLARYCRAVCVPYAACLTHFPSRTALVVTGNPVRPQVETRTREEGCRALGLDPGRPTLLVLGGSRGARRVVEAALDALPAVRRARPQLQVLIIGGRDYYPQALARLQDTGEDGDVRLEPYVYNMEDALAAADLVVGRAGAMTVAEVTVRGLPAILIPSPNVVGRHQDFNARQLEKEGAARVIPEDRLDGQALAHMVNAILGDTSLREAMARSSRRLGRPDAARRVAEVVVQAALRPGRAGSLLAAY